MSRHSSLGFDLVRVTAVLCALLLVSLPPLSVSADDGVLSSTVPLHRSEVYEPAMIADVAATVAALPTDTVQRFDYPNTGTPYFPDVHVPAPTRAAELMAGGPRNEGYFLRLAFPSPVPNHNSITFPSTNTALPSQIVACFDLRMSPSVGRADGIGFALLNTSEYGTTGPIAPQAPLFAAEEPNFAGSLGIGFDIHQATERNEISNNHLSIHLNGALVQEIDATPSLDLASGRWLRTVIVMRPGDSGGEVSVMIAPDGEPAVTLVDRLEVTGFTPYQGRVHFAGRSGGESADHDIDNILVQYLDQSQTLATAISRCIPTVAQNFDESLQGTSYIPIDYVPPGPPITTVVGGPTGVGNALRLSSPITQSHHGIAFGGSTVGTPSQVVVDFDFRITLGTGRADGFGVALVDTATFGLTGTVPIASVAEEPNFAHSLGIGFDIYRSNEPALEVNDNHLSLHYDGRLLEEVDVSPALDLAGQEWIHAQILMRLGSAQGDVSITLTQCGRPPVRMVNQMAIPGFTPYSGRLHIAARSGGLAAAQDFDNIHVQFLSATQGIVSFQTGCYSVVESDQAATLSLQRSGSLAQPLTVTYLVTDTTAISGSDYQGNTGSITFAAGEVSQTLNIPLIDDQVSEGDESIIVLLTSVTGDAEIGGPAVAKVTIVDDEQAQELGHWGEFIPAQVVPIQMAMLPTGKVLYWDRHDEQKQWDGHPRLWDPLTETITHTAPIDYDLFCSGHSFLADGRLLITGGHIRDAVGEDKATLYDPFTDTWQRLPPMNKGRWYPSNVTLTNGDVLVMAGSYTTTTVVSMTGIMTLTKVNPLPQVFEAKTNTWRDLTTAAYPDETNTYPTYADYYPFLYLASNGHIFSAGPQRTARYLDPTGTGTWRDVAESTLLYRDYGSSVMYGDGKILLVGGNPRDPDLNTNPTILPSASAEVIDLNAAQPTWRTVDSMHFGRRQHTATLLPDGKVLVTGGSSSPGFDKATGAVLTAEVWDPRSEQWSTLAAQQGYRGYHSTALLLPDGRVLVGGGGHPDSEAGAQPNFEIYSPPYLFKGARPTIANAPAEVTYNQRFTIETPDIAAITKVTWIRLSAVTHAFNQDQRINTLAFRTEAGALTITTPTQSALAPPGYYMLFILNQEGVPSIAHVIRLVGESVYLPITWRDAG